MKKQQGFTLIELIMFIIVTSILATTILLAFVTALNKTPVVLQNMIADQVAKQCMEWFVGQRRMNGYNSITCNSTTPTFCSAPSGYTISTSCNTTTISGDSNYETIAVTVSGLGNASLSYLMAVY
jgi:type II secretory pathway pseudopilin PulG